MHFPTGRRNGRLDLPLEAAQPEGMANAEQFLIADDHPMVRDALASALGQAFAGAQIAMAGTLAEVQVELERQPEVDALLLDLDMPGMDGLTGLALLRSDHPAVPIIIVSAARERGVVRRAYEFGASAYIDKSASLEEIARIVRAVLAGEIFAPPEATPADSFAQRAAQLTPQQWRVLALMVQGDQNKQIAHKLGVGEATVKAHVTVILRKLGVRSRTQAVIEARDLALPPTEPARP
jgi:DNA-binding NarL/FixJ family response regulator